VAAEWIEMESFYAEGMLPDGQLGSVRVTTSPKYAAIPELVERVEEGARLAYVERFGVEPTSFYRRTEGYWYDPDEHDDTEEV
jgi:hypothetical protein